MAKGSSRRWWVDQADGTWAQAETVTSPAEPKSGPYGASLSSVACTAAGKCIAVGGYTDGCGRSAADAGRADKRLLEQLGDGCRDTGGRRQPSRLRSRCHRLSGAGSGSCVALGYFEENEYREMMIASASTSGVGTPVKVTPPANTVAEGSASWPTATNYLGPVLAGVGCSDPGTCVSIGNYPATPLGEILPMSATGSSASASEITTISQPAGQSSGSLGVLIAIACPGTGYCEAGGGVDGEAMVLSEAPNGYGARRPRLLRRPQVPTRACRGLHVPTSTRVSR